MRISKVQLKDLIHNHLRQENGFQDILQMVVNSAMVAERREYLDNDSANKGNGYRLGRTYGNGKVLELRIPRDRNGGFYPKMLALLREQEAEIDRLVSALYGQGLSQAQIGEVFEQFYGRHYSTSQISRMIEWMREDVARWLRRTLETRYPVVFIDAIHVKVRRDTVANEAFYVVLGVTPEGRREVLAIGHKPTEAAGGWKMLLQELRDRGVSEIGLIVADGLKGLGKAVGEAFPGTPLQWCIIHIKRELGYRVRPEDREALYEDMAAVFATDNPQDSPEAGWARWQDFCGRWSGKYAVFRRLKDDEAYRTAFTYLGYAKAVRSMIYTTNWIERLNRSFRAVLKNRSAMPNETAVITLLGHVAMNQKAFNRKLPGIDKDPALF